jgi:hypothetical protein
VSGHKPIQPAVTEAANNLARLIGLSLPEGWGFALLMFEFGDGDRMNYISNATREDMLAALKEFIAHAEGRAPESTETRQ